MPKASFALPENQLTLREAVRFHYYNLYDYQFLGSVWELPFQRCYSSISFYRNIYGVKFNLHKLRIIVSLKRVYRLLVSFGIEGGIYPS